MAVYAFLDQSHTVVISEVDLDPATIADWVASSNPKSYFYLPIDDGTQPFFDPSTQSVSQNGYNIGGAVVTRVWVINALSPAAQTAIAATNTWNAAIALNLVTQLTSDDSNWSTLTSDQKDADLRSLVKFVNALLQYQYQITT